MKDFLSTLFAILLTLYPILLSIAIFCDSIDISIARTRGKEICSEPKQKLMFHKFLPSRQIACFLMKEVNE